MSATPAAVISNISKTYAGHAAVDDISFSINPGEIFGLIGPNGAGKTTTIRMMMDIIKPDAGSITVFGEKLSEASKNKLGYMPEERGLYKKLRIFEVITYLASLKGVDAATAIERGSKLLDLMGLKVHTGKRIEELSKGMGQVVQFIITVVHDPQLIVLDEPFVGLDPVNTELITNHIIELRNQGKAIILSAHQMNTVEALCDRILMINKGRAVLYGDLKEIKSRFADNSVILDYKSDLGEIPGVVEKRPRRDYVELVLDGHTTPGEVLQYLVSRGIVINRFEIATPPLNEIFIKVVGEDNE
jgi:ABC-2 type transport system ATP-binding protein